MESKFPNDKLMIGETIEINKDYSHTKLNNDKCLIKGNSHGDYPKSMYLERLHNFLTIRCDHSECAHQIYPCQHI